MKYKIMKVFDCQEMPKDVKKAFLDSFEQNNDCAVLWTVDDSTEPPEGQKLIDDWLFASGAEELEDVMIKYWW